MKLLLVTFLFISGFCSIPHNNSLKHTLKVRLIKAHSNPPGCGVLAWALTQKFEIIESADPNMKPKSFILLHKACPDFLGNNYFIAGKEYEVIISETSGASFEYILINSYEKENLPSFWIKEIKLKNN